MKKFFDTFLVCMLLSCSFIVCSSVTFVAGASVDKLPTPELVSVTYSDYSYDVPASTSVDSFTGKTIEHPAYHVDNRTLTFVINKKNISTDPSSYLYYIIRMKGSFSNEWNTITSRIKPELNSPLTTVVLTLPSPETILSGDADQIYHYPLEGKADFQVQAQEWGQIPSELGPPFESSHVETLFAASDWSNIKTVTFGQNSGNGTSNQPNPNLSPTSSLNQSESQNDAKLAVLNLPELVLVTALCIIIVMLLIALMYKRNRAKNKP
jgi:hypothetical protein